LTSAVQTLLNSFDALSKAEQHEVVVAVLRRTEFSLAGELSDEELVAAADVLFRELDRQEAADARTNAPTR
jgi:hypothetical protein